MKKKIFLGLSMAVALSLAACGGQKAAESGEKGSDAAKAEGTEVSENSVLSVEVGPPSETIDPALNNGREAAMLVNHAFEGLLRYDKDGNTIPGQAESYEKSEDGLTYTFHIREGLKWSDGSDLTAKDFLYSWKRVADPATASPYAEELLGMVKGYKEAAAGDLDALGLEAPDDKTFVVHLSYPCSYFEQICAFAVMVPVQEATVEANGDAWTNAAETYVSNGPYFVSAYSQDEQFVLTKNPNYWNKDNITFETINWHLVKDSNAAYTAYNQGELDFAKDFPKEELESVQKTPDYHIDPLRGTYFMIFNANKEPFNNPKVRAALSLALDREYIGNSIMQGIYTPATNFVGTGVSDAAEGSAFEKVTEEKYGNAFNLEDYDAQLAKAKELLAEAGYPNGEGFPAFSYSTNDVDYHKPVAEYAQDVWNKELGLNCSISILEWASFTADRRSGNFDVARQGWVYDWDDPANILNLLGTTNGNNDGKYSNAEFDSIMEKSKALTDRAAYYEAMHEAEQLALKDAAIAPIAYYNDTWVQKENLKNVWHLPNGFWYFMYATKE
jgi:dipeptide ABC superfamily ATP binding cassette transporter, binding protein